MTNKAMISMNRVWGVSFFLLATVGMATAASPKQKADDEVNALAVTTGGEGTMKNPYTVADVNAIFKGSVPTSQKWVKGKILGSVTSSGNLTATYNEDNIALGDDSDNYIAVPLKTTVNYLRDILNLKTNPNNKDKEILVCGVLGKYNNHNGIKEIKRISGFGPKITISNGGYGTFYNEYPYNMPSGMKGGVVTKAENGELVIDYRYKEGSSVLAKTALFINATNLPEDSYDYSIYDNSTINNSDKDNLLHGADAVDKDSMTFVAGTNVKYYILSNDKSGSNLSFYWAAHDGGPIQYQAPYAFLAIDFGSGDVNSVKMPSIKEMETAGINPIRVTETIGDKDAIYNITGMRMDVGIDMLPKGIYIIGGKKTVIK